MNIEEKINILLVEDLFSDVELVRYELKRNGFHFNDLVVSTEDEYKTGLETFAPDLILSDYNMPSFNGMQALLIRQKFAPMVPFILVTGSLNEEIAVELIKTGADDYILKENLIRLGPAIKSAIEKQENIRYKKEIEEDLLRERILLRTVIDNLPDTIYVKDESGRKLIANKADVQLIGFGSEAEVIGKTDIELFKNELGERGYADDLFVLKNNQSIIDREEYFYDAEGHIRWLLTSKIPLCDEHNKIVGLVGIGRDITEKKKADDALKESEAIFNAFMNYSPILILFKDQKARFVRISKTFEQIFGKSTDEVMGKTMYEMFPAKASEQMVADDFQVINHGLPIKKIERFNDRIYETIKFPIIRENLPNFLAGYSIDITERRIAEKRLKENHQKLSAILDNLHGVVYLCNNDPDFTMNYISDGITELSGYPPKDFIDNQVRSFNSIIHKDDQQLVWDEIQAAVEIKQGYSFEYRIITSEGNIKWVWERGKGLFERDHLVHLEGFISDITSRKKAEEELIGAKEKAEESDHLKTAFLHNISHEIRTPMNAIVGFSQFLNKPGLSHEKQHQFTDIICQSSNQLMSIINDIVNSASIETGQEKLKRSKFNVNSTLHELYEQFLLKTKPKNLKLQCLTPLEDAQVVLLNDETKLVQVISNLLNNAIKFTQKGEIKFGYLLKNHELEFYVEDTGMGIAKEMHQKIFERFTQADESIAQFYGGTGLGLSISKGYVELMGGRIWVESEPAGGSVFYFTLPYLPENIETKPTTSFPSDIPCINSVLILVVEDEETNFFLVSEILAEMKVQVLKASNGQEAVDLCKSNPAINLVLMDLKMPVMDGFEATKQIKAFRPELPVIAQSAYVHDKDKEKAFRFGCDDYITKPLDFEHLVAAINKFV